LGAFWRSFDLPEIAVTRSGLIAMSMRELDRVKVIEAVAMYVAIRCRIPWPLPPIRLKTPAFFKPRILSLTVPSLPLLLITDSQIERSSFQLCRPLTTT
jgi:hypothetical protein